MVGQGVLRECLRDEAVDRVLCIGRRSTGVAHPKLHELIRADMFDADLAGVTLAPADACFFCLGVSSLGMSEADYTRQTFDLTVAWATALARVNPQMTFMYVSGAGTGGKSMWARVKGRTESALLALFSNAYMVRLGALRPMNGEMSKARITRIAYVVFRPLLPLIRLLAPNLMITTEELGRAMLRVAKHGAPTHILEMHDLRTLGDRA
jgi:uncharacterized protein YbjT (DUF2867 family)